MGYSPWVKDYSSAYKSIVSHKISSAIDRISLSEFINRALRQEYEKHLKEENISRKVLSYKDFRNQLYGQETVREVYSIVENKILKNFEFVDKAMTSSDILSVIKEDFIDFNDKIILNVCKEYNMILLTNDGDYKNASVDILTANPALLHS